jgi:hypothetical protein
MAVTVTGLVYGDPEVHTNRAGDITVSLQVMLLGRTQNASTADEGSEHIVRIIVATDPLTEHVLRDIRGGDNVVVTARRLEVETFHDAGPRAVVVADDVKLAATRTQRE